MSAVPLPDIEHDEPVESSADSAPVPQRAGPEPPAEEGAPTWMVTFGDMMALLLTFFILLFSMSELEAEKFREAAKSLHEGFGTSTEDLGDVQPVIAPATDSSSSGGRRDPVTDRLDAIADALDQFVVENGLEQSLLVDRTDEGVYLRIRDAALFQPGFAEVEEQSAWIIEKLSLITRAIEVPVTVAGHTDNVPISNSQFESNWELSAARAAGVARALVDLGHDASMVQVTAFGEHRPIASNDTEEGRAKNRRVELFYSRQSIEDTENGPQGSPEEQQSPETGTGTESEPQ